MVMTVKDYLPGMGQFVALNTSATHTVEYRVCRKTGTEHLNIGRLVFLQQKLISAKTIQVQIHDKKHLFIFL